MHTLSERSIVADPTYETFARSDAAKPLIEAALNRYEELRADASGLSRNQETGQFTYNHFSDISEAQIGALANLTFQGWLDQRPELEPIVPIMYSLIVRYLYGTPAMLTAYHGLDWCQPEKVRSFADYYINPDQERLLEKIRPVTGFQGVVAAMAHQAQLKVVYNVHIKRVVRSVCDDACDTFYVTTSLVKNLSLCRYSSLKDFCTKVRWWLS